MIDFLKFIQKTLLEVTPNVRRELAPENVKEPYLVTSYSTIEMTGEYLERGILTVDGFCNCTDTTDLEILMASVEYKLNKKVHVEDNILISIYTENKQTMDMFYPTLKHRSYTFQVRIYNGGF